MRYVQFERMGLDEYRDKCRSKKNGIGKGVYSRENKSSFDELEEHDFDSDKMVGFVLGLIVGEGSFSINICRKGSSISVKPKFGIRMHKENSYMLKYICSSVDVGFYSERNNEEFCSFRISAFGQCVRFAEWIDNVREGTVFNETAKMESFEIWKDCLSDIKEGNDKTYHGIVEIARKREGINRDNRCKGVDEVKDMLDSSSMFE